MKLTDLAILDWVLINNTPHKIQAIDGIDAEILADDNLYYVGEDRCHSEDKIEGIPITPEILEENGWKRTECKSDIEYEHDDAFMFLIVEGNYVRCIIADYNRFGKIDSLGVSFAELCHLHYVHELQHTLRLCGLNELADNFKI